ncbi:MAG: DUF1992 domain-containing protein [Desulfobulbus sp.]|jgi:hypothetical protein
MLSIIQQIAERKIQQAMAEGTLHDLSHWKNKPLPEEDLSHVPEDLRMAYRLLKNAGYIPEELALRKEIVRTEQLLATCTDSQEKLRQLRRISCLQTRLEIRTGRRLELGEGSPYFENVVDRLSTPAAPASQPSENSSKKSK